MITPSFFGKASLYRLFLTALLAMGMGLSSAQALLLTPAQASAAAARIMAAAEADRNNTAFDVAKEVTLGSDSADAAANAALIVQALPAASRALLAGRVGMGVAWNFHNQIAAITLNVGSINEVGNAPALFVQQITAASVVDQVEQIAYSVVKFLAPRNTTAAQMDNLMQTMIDQVSNRVDITAGQRATVEARVTAAFASGVKSTQTHSAFAAQITQLQKAKYDAIVNNFVESVKVLVQQDPAGVRNAIGNFVLNLKDGNVGQSMQAMTFGESSSATNSWEYLVRKLVETINVNISPAVAQTATQTITDVVVNNNTTDVYTGPVSGQVSPH